MSAPTTISNFVYNPSVQYLFGRTYALAIGAPRQTSALQYSNIDMIVNGQTLKASPLRIVFDIEKRLAGTSNKSKIQIYNLSSQNRSKIKPGFLLQLQAGYRGLMDTIFVGNVDLHGAVSERKEGGIITSFECGEGESTIVMSRLDQAFPAGSTLQQVLEAVAKAMSVNSVVTDQGIGFGSVVGIPNQSYPRGITLQGSCKDSLDKITKNFGLRWGVNNGNLVIIPAGSNIQQTAIVVSSGAVTDPATGLTKFDPTKATGLIGVPSVTMGNLTKFTTLLNPKIVPGALVQLKCEDTTLNGFYTIQTAHYEGDTHQNKWQINCEAAKAQNVGQKLPVAQGSNFKTAVT